MENITEIMKILYITFADFFSSTIHKTVYKIIATSVLNFTLDYICIIMIQ